MKQFFRSESNSLKLAARKNLADYFYLTLVIGIGFFITILVSVIMMRNQTRSLKSDFLAYSALTQNNLELYATNQMARLHELEKRSSKPQMAAALRDTVFNKVLILSKSRNRLRVQTEIADFRSPQVANSELMAAKQLGIAISKLDEYRERFLPFFLITNKSVMFTVVWKSAHKPGKYLAAFTKAEHILPPGIPNTSYSFMFEQHRPFPAVFGMTKADEKSPFVFTPINHAKLEAKTRAVPNWLHASIPFLFATATTHIFGSPSHIENYLLPFTTLISGCLITALLGMIVFGLINRNIAIEEQVQIKTRDLAIESRKAKDAAHSKTRFLANVSHEVRTPLNMVLGMSDLLRETKLTREQSIFVDNLTKAGNHLIRLIDDILDLTRLESNDIKIVTQYVDTLEYFESIASLIYPMAQQKGLDFNIQIDPHLPKNIKIDPERLRQVIFNLINNSLKFTEQGAIFLELKLARSGTAVPPMARVEIIVRDTGIGISKPDLQKVFREFYQVDSSSKRNKGGVGLGLSIVQALIGRMNGSVRVNSEINQGTMFSIQLPVEINSSESWGHRLRNPKGLQKILCLHKHDYTLPLLQQELAESLVQLDALEFNSNVLDYVSSHWNAYDIILFEIKTAEDFLLLHALGDPIHLRKKALLLVDESPFSPELRRELEYWRRLPKPLLPSSLLTALGFESEWLKSKSFHRFVPALTGAQNFESMRNKSVLIAEDDEGNCLLLEAYLKGLPCNYTIVKNGLMAYEHCIRQKPDLLITDLQMPVMDGFELIEKLREWEESSAYHANIVVLTADALIESNERARALGVRHFVTKPMRKNEFLHVLSTSLSLGEAEIKQQKALTSASL